jgi:hypothetical protein
MQSFNLDDLCDALEDVFPFILTTSGWLSVTCGESQTDVKPS